jgi:hypothetical protein
VGRSGARVAGPSSERVGDDALFCNAGELARVDCTALGFTGCFDDPAFGCE